MISTGSNEFNYLLQATDRTALTRIQVEDLKNRFEKELLRQAKAAAEAAKNAITKATATNEGNGKAVKQHVSHHQKKVQPATRAEEQHGVRSPPAAAKASPNSETGGLANSAKSSKNKKKKRSALANASNPHHLRNYVPSRLPNSEPTATALPARSAQNLISPLPVRFLCADLPRYEKNDRVVPQSRGPRGNTAEEWICSFCEYDLFYGWDASFRDAVKSRKKVLRRRRRARERAARAASGLTRSAVEQAEDETDEEAEYDEDDEADTTYDASAKTEFDKRRGVEAG